MFAGIVGFGAAATLAKAELNDEPTRLCALREYILTELKRNLPGCYLFGHEEQRLPGHLSVGFHGHEREVGAILTFLDNAGVAVSAGSACSANHSGEPSSVLLAMGYDDERARGLIRISLGRFNTRQEVDRFLQIVSSGKVGITPQKAQIPTDLCVPR